MSAADQINELRGLSNAGGGVVRNNNELIQKGLEHAYPRISKDEKEALASQLEVKSDGKVKIGDREITVGELDFIVANSIQTITSETDPKNEYFTWIEDGIDIIKDMSTDGVTKEELERRNEFLTDLDQRETEVKMCISLYQRAAMGTGHLADTAKEKIAFLQKKWAKLMEIRSAVKLSTQNYADEKKSDRIANDRTKLYLLALYFMRQGREIPHRLKTKLEINYGITFEDGLAEQMISRVNREPLTKKQTIDRINALRGRLPEGERPVLSVHKQNFNSAQFERLSRQYMNSYN